MYLHFCRRVPPPTTKDIRTGEKSSKEITNTPYNWMRPMWRATLNSICYRYLLWMYSFHSSTELPYFSLTITFHLFSFYFVSAEAEIDDESCDSLGFLFFRSTYHLDVLSNVGSILVFSLWWFSYLYLSRMLSIRCMKLPNVPFITFHNKCICLQWSLWLMYSRFLDH